MHVAARARLLLARRPWLYWLAVGVLATSTAMLVHQRITALDDARRAWGETRRVLVARDALAPGDPILVDDTELPVAVVPRDALAVLPTGARLRQHVADGEVLTIGDLTSRAGPGGRARPGTVVVGISDPLVPHTAIGAPVQVAADGLLLADGATVVDSIDGVVLVAVDAADGPAVAAAAQQGVASVLHLP